MLVRAVTCTYMLPSGVQLTIERSDTLSLGSLGSEQKAEVQAPVTAPSSVKWDLLRGGTRTASAQRAEVIRDDRVCGMASVPYVVAHTSLCVYLFLRINFR